MGSWGSFDFSAEHPGFLASYFFLPKITNAPNHRHFSRILRLAPPVRNLTPFILSRSSSSFVWYTLNSTSMVFKAYKIKRTWQFKHSWDESLKTSRQKQSDKLCVLRHLFLLWELFLHKYLTFNVITCLGSFQVGIFLRALELKVFVRDFLTLSLLLFINFWGYVSL